MAKKKDKEPKWEKVPEPVQEKPAPEPEPVSEAEVYTPPVDPAVGIFDAEPSSSSVAVAHQEIESVHGEVIPVARAAAKPDPAPVTAALQPAGEECSKCLSFLSPDLSRSSGECHRLPAQVVLLNQSQWPLVEKTKWCLEFKARK